MTKTAELKIRLEPSLKKTVTEVYSQWGLTLSDAVTVFFNKSVEVGGLPFDLRKSEKQFNEDFKGFIPIDSKLGHAILPADWDDAEDNFYDEARFGE
jgi:DNA-damage-inducible protein J